MQITKHKAVGIGYRLRDEAGQLIESRDALTPLYYLHGEGMLLPIIEEALEGKQKGDRFTLSIPPDSGYGERDADLVEDVPRSAFGLTPDQAVEAGTELRGSLEQTATVVAVSPDTLTIDANHPLAGKTLQVEGEVIDVRDAIQEEITLGRVSGQDDGSLLINVTLRSQKDTE
jgi:FKBP-type peptidyl-prolyl cis-trans isomerase SlyD